MHRIISRIRLYIVRVNFRARYVNYNIMFDRVVYTLQYIVIERYLVIDIPVFYYYFYMAYSINYDS
jgi:hypothetical protein